MAYYKLPDEILLNISKFSNNEKDTFNKVLTDLKVSLEIKNLNKKYELSKECFNIRCRIHGRSRVYHSYFNNNHAVFKLILRRTYSKTELKQVFKNLKGCNCCERHKTNCPEKISSEWDEDPIYIDYLQCPKNCKCRYYKRRLCEVYNNY